MKIFNLVSNIVIIVAIVLMWALHPKCGDSSCADSAPISATDMMPMAYVNIDSILMNYQKAIDLNEDLMAQEEEIRTSLTEQARLLEADMQEFQRKVENNGFLSRERAQAKQQQLVGRQQQLEQLQQKKSNELSLKQQDLNQTILESLDTYIKEYNKTAGYHMILTQNGAIGTVIYANQSYNITATVLSELNEQYARKK